MLQRRIFVPLGIVLTVAAVLFATAVDLSDGRLTWRTARAIAGNTVTVTDGTVESTPSVPSGTSDQLDVVVYLTGSGDSAMGLAAYDFTLTWDASVFRVDSVAGGDAPFSGTTVGTIDNTGGSVKFVEAITAYPGPTGSFIVARVNITGVCPNSGTSPVTIDLFSGTHAFRDPNYAAISKTIVAGTVTCTATTEPGAPTGVTATAGDAQADVSWTAPASDGGSAILYYTVTSSPGSISATSSTTTATVTGLTNGTSYTFTVTATNAIGTGPASSPSNAVIPFTVPGAPTGVTATEGNALADVSWTAPSFDGFSSILYYTVTSSPGAVSATSSATAVTVTGLSNGTEYTFTVTATNAAGEGPASYPPSNAVTPATVPDPPTSVIATAAGETSVSVTWTPGFNGGSAILYYVVLSSPGAVSVTSTTASATVTGLTSGTEYTFTVTATNALGTSAPSSPSNGATPTPFKAYPFMRLHRDSTDYSGTATWDGPGTGTTGVIVGITDVRDAGGTPISGVLLAGYQAELRFVGTCLNVLDIRAGRDFAAPVQYISTSTGVAYFNQANISGDEPESIMAFAKVRLIGDKNAICNLEVVFTDLVDVNGVSIAVDTTPVIAEFRRGNALDDANFNIGDALFTSQYLVGLRSGCTAIKPPGGAPVMTCINPVNVVDVIPDGSINIGDVLFIKQNLVGLRDDNFQ